MSLGSLTASKYHEFFCPNADGSHQDCCVCLWGMRFLDSGLAYLPTLQNYFPLHKILQKALSCWEERHCKMQTNQSIDIKEWEKSITPLSLEEAHYLIALTDLSPPYLKGKICRLETASCPPAKKINFCFTVEILIFCCFLTAFIINNILVSVNCLLCKVDKLSRLWALIY